MLKHLAESSPPQTFSSLEEHGLFLQLPQKVPIQQQGRKPSLSVFPLGRNTPQADRRDQSGNVASRLAHDLANILTAIQGNTELAALHLPQQSSLKRYLDNILFASQRGNEFLEDLLHGIPHQQAFHEELDLCILVEEVLEVFRATLPPTITIQKIDQLSSGKMTGHSTQLFRMLSNLVSNAVRAMYGQERGTLTIILDKVLETEPLPFANRVRTDYMRLRVQDTGVGMSPELCQKIFNPYFTTHQHGKGVGLGLAIVKEVVADHGGVVSVESQPERGSTFTVFLPIFSPSHSQMAHANQLAS